MASDERFPRKVGFSKFLMREGNPEYIETGDGVIIVKVIVSMSYQHDSWVLPGTYRVTKICDKWVETERIEDTEPPPGAFMCIRDNQLDKR